MLGPLLAQLSRVLATRESLFSDHNRARLGRWRSLDARAAVCGVLNGVLYVLASLRWASYLSLTVFALLFSTLLVVSIIDCEHYRIPDRISFPAMASAAMVVVVATVISGHTERLIGAALGAALFWGGLGVAHLASPRGMGRGDVKLAVVLGIALGWVAPRPLDAVLLVLAAFFCASVVGTAVGLVLLAWRRRNAPYPFGPSLVTGVVAVLLLSEQVARAR